MASAFDDLVDEALGPELVEQFGTSCTATIAGSPVVFTAAAVPERGERENDQGQGERSVRHVVELIFNTADAALSVRTAVAVGANTYAVTAIESLGGTWAKATLERSPLTERTRPGYRG